MKKLPVLLFVMFCFISFNASAQFYGGATLGLQVPYGDFTNNTKMGFGVNLSGKSFLNKDMAVGLNIGYNRFGLDGYRGDEIDIKAFTSMIPVTALLEYYFKGKSVKPYIGADLGIYSFGSKVLYEGATESKSEIHPGLAPVAGITYGRRKDFKLCANIKLHNVFGNGGTESWLGINAGVIVTLN